MPPSSSSCPEPNATINGAKGIPHGYFNQSDAPAQALFWGLPAGKLKQLFDTIDGLTDPEEVVKIAAQHEVDFLPPEAND